MTITISMVNALLPQLIISLGLVLSMLLIAWQRSKLLIQFVTMLIFAIALIACINFSSEQAIQVTPLLLVDGYSKFALALMLLSAITTTVLSHNFLNKHIEAHDEYYLLLQLVVFGASVLVVSDHFASVFLGFEILSIALVGLIGYIRDSHYSIESGFKYLILSATASSFMLMGMAYIYSEVGSLSFTVSGFNSLQQSNLYLMGTLLFIAGMAFKLSLVPFHYWTPDVYQGSPTPVTMLLATVSKVAMFTSLAKYWFSQDYFANTTLTNVVAIIAILSMLVGNILALKQANLKRLLGYSSIAHMGYLLIILMITATSSIDFAWQSAQFYLAAYVIASLSVFIVINITGQTDSLEDDILVSHWRGLFWSQPLTATLVIIALLSFAGIPLTMGFIAKFYLLTHATNEQLWYLIAALIAGSGIALCYYLNVIFALFNLNINNSSELHLPFYVRTMIVVFIVIGILLGLQPDLFLPMMSV